MYGHFTALEINAPTTVHFLFMRQDRGGICGTAPGEYGTSEHPPPQRKVNMVISKIQELLDLALFTSTHPPIHAQADLLEVPSKIGAELHTG